MSGQDWHTEFSIVLRALPREKSHHVHHSSWLCKGSMVLFSTLFSTLPPHIVTTTKTGRPPTDTLCVLVTSASPLHLKQNWNDSTKCVCVVQNMKKENTIFSHHKEKKWRQFDRLRTNACAGHSGVPALRITLLCFSSSVKCKQVNLCQKLPFPETAVPASG